MPCKIFFDIILISSISFDIAELFPQKKDGARGGKRPGGKRDFSSSRKKFKRDSKPGDDKDSKRSASENDTGDRKWKMDGKARPKGRVMNKRTMGGKGPAGGKRFEDKKGKGTKGKRFDDRKDGGKRYEDYKGNRGERYEDSFENKKGRGSMTKGRIGKKGKRQGGKGVSRASKSKFTFSMSKSKK